MQSTVPDGCVATLHSQSKIAFIYLLLSLYFRVVIVSERVFTDRTVYLDVLNIFMYILDLMRQMNNGRRN